MSNYVASRSGSAINRLGAVKQNEKMFCLAPGTERGCRMRMLRGKGRCSFRLPRPTPMKCNLHLVPPVNRGSTATCMATSPGITSRSLKLALRYENRLLTFSALGLKYNNVGGMGFPRRIVGTKIGRVALFSRSNGVLTSHLFFIFPHGGSSGLILHDLPSDVSPCRGVHLSFRLRSDLGLSGGNLFSLTIASTSRLLSACSAEGVYDRLLLSSRLENFVRGISACFHRDDRHRTTTSVSLLVLMRK